MNLSTDDIPDEYLRDEKLRRALLHAPDHQAAPDWRIRKAILQSAHDAIAGTPVAAPDAGARPWWKLFGSHGSSSSRMPWNAAFATVLVAVLVTVIWQREPVPGAAPDGEARVTAPGPKKAGVPGTAAPSARSATSAPSAPSESSDRAALPTPPGANEEPAPSSDGTTDARRERAEVPPSADAKPSPPESAESANKSSASAFSLPPLMPAPAPASPADEEAARKAIADAMAARARMEERAAAEAALEPPATPSPPPAPPAPAASAAPSQSQSRTQPPPMQSSTLALPSPTPYDAPATRATRATPATPATPAAPPAGALIGPSGPAGALGASGGSGDAAGVARAARPAAPTVRTETTDPPTFAALSQWNRMTIAQPGGASRTLSRNEASTLNALLGSAAISAVGPQPLGAAPEWRITLERSGEVLAVFDIARGRVRWREGLTPAATGAPSANALSALRDALKSAVQPPPEPQFVPPAQPQAPMRQGAAPDPDAETAPSSEPPRNP